MAIVVTDDLIGALPGQAFNFYKPSQTAKAAGAFHSLWKAAGFPAAGASPGSVNGAINTSATTGAFVFSNPTGGDTGYLARASATGATVGTLIIYDRIWTNSGLSGTSVVSQTFTQPTLTRYASGEGLELWFECYTPTGVTAVTITATYKNTVPTGSRSATCALIASPVAGQMIPFVLQSGDTGISELDAVILSLSTGTAGDWGCTILRRLAEIPLPVANVGQGVDAFDIGLPVIQNSACLAFMVACSTTNTGNVIGSMNIVQT